MLTGPLDTPYAAGCFFFDVTLHDYPHRAPSVKFLTTGGGRVQFNPNLYPCGRVCLSLLGTWSGPGWQPNVSTLLQVLVSIQGLILVPDPYFNEPGYERRRGSATGKALSDEYNRKLIPHTLRYGMLEPLQQAGTTTVYPEFATAINRHFAFHRQRLVENIFPGWLARDGSLRTLIGQVTSALNALPPLPDMTTSRRAKKATAAKEPETISLLPDEDDVSKPAAAAPRVAGADVPKEPETISLLDD